MSDMEATFRLRADDGGMFLDVIYPLDDDNDCVIACVLDRASALTIVKGIMDMLDAEGHDERH